MTVRFVIIAPPRTGSNMLCSLLHSHTGIVCHHEVFNPRGIFLGHDYDAAGLDLGTPVERDRDPGVFLHRLWDCFSTHSCVGFKITREQGALIPLILERESGLRIILLTRDNRLRTYVSELIAQALDQWEVYDEKDLIEDRPEVSITASGLADHARMNAAFIHGVKQLLEGYSGTILQTTFERLDDPEEHRRILRFLGADETRALVPTSVRQNRLDLRGMIANFDQLREELAGTEFEHELDSSPA